MPGATVFVGVNQILKLNHGETIFISAASGAVGSLASQIAKLRGAKSVIGSAGGEKKCNALKDFGYDFAIDYRTIKSKEELSSRIKELSPGGIDLYFENVGGMHFDAAFENLRMNGRVAICGSISGYNDPDNLKAMIVPLDMIFKRLRIEGYHVGDCLSGEKESENFVEVLGAWLKEGKLISKNTIVEGINRWGETFCSLFNGTQHIGKLSIRV